ncbi:MAG: xanthine dehydrogenase family protein [Rhodobacteraceae bacterium]|nr:xanthine dehydrogenase family protein [Paracoccaceae bacterium]
MRVLRGQGRYVADIALPGALHLAFLRSPVARGRIVALDTADAAAMPGVRAVFTGADVGGLPALAVNPVLDPQHIPGWPVLACEAVGALGQPVAAVVAETVAQALDAVEAIVLDIDEAGAGGADTPLAALGVWREGDAAARLDEAAHVVEARIRHPRLAPSPMETRGIAVLPDGAGGAHVWLSSQTPHRARTELARILGLPAESLRVTAPDVGGAFGMKASLYPEDVLAVLAALRLDRPLRWIASRSEDFLSATHGRGAESVGRLAVDTTGRMTAITARLSMPLGHWLSNSSLVPAWNAGRMLTGCYGIGAVDIESAALLSATAPVGIYRGAGRPEAIVLLESLVDRAARACGHDPLEFRIANALPPEALPHVTPTGTRLDSGDYAAALRQLRVAAEYDAARAAQARARATGALHGIGIAAYVEPCGTGWESARVTLHADGTATVATGGSTQGQGRETALSQIAAGTLGIAPEAVTVLHGDTAHCPEGIGALASRSTPIGGSAVLRACEAVLARRARGETGEIAEEIVYTAPAEAWGSGAALAEMTIDPETGTPSLLRIVMVDDAGRLINPALVAGQILGGIAQGLGEALMERIVHDEDGQLLTGTLMDYALPRASDMPPVSLHKCESATDANALGAKGVGEAGTIAAPAAILNAALDALAPLGVTDLALPLTSETLWRAIRSAPRTGKVHR